MTVLGIILGFLAGLACGAAFMLVMICRLTEPVPDEKVIEKLSGTGGYSGFDRL